MNNNIITKLHILFFIILIKLYILKIGEKKIFKWTKQNERQKLNSRVICAIILFCSAKMQNGMCTS